MQNAQDDDLFLLCIHYEVNDVGSAAASMRCMLKVERPNIQAEFGSILRGWAIWFPRQHRQPLFYDVAISKCLVDAEEAYGVARYGRKIGIGLSRQPQLHCVPFSTASSKIASTERLEN